MKKKRVRTSVELIEKLNDTMDRFDNGEVDITTVNAHTKLIDSMCRVVKVSNDVSKDLLRFDDGVEHLRPFVGAKRLVGREE